MGLEKLNEIKKIKGWTNEQLAAISGVPKTTIDKITAGTNTNPKLGTLQALCKALGCRLDDLDDNQITTKKAPPEMSDEAKALAKDYDNLDAHGKKIVRNVTDLETERMSSKVIPLKKINKVIPLLGNSFAAGPGEPDFGNMWEDYEVPADSKADFAIKVTGTSMEPYLHDGSIALGVRETPNDGDVGAFLVDGEFLVKQVCMDIYDNLYLFSLNRAEKDSDRHLMHFEEHTVFCFGKIIMKKRVPLPNY